MKAERARLDADRRCRPMTEIVAVVRPPENGRLVVFINDIVRYELRDVSHLAYVPTERRP